MIGSMMVFVQNLPKITLFYWLLTLIGVAQFSLIFIVPAFVLDIVDYIAKLT